MCYLQYLADLQIATWDKKITKTNNPYKMGNILILIGIVKIISIVS